jgi:hypothetical protein
MGSILSQQSTGVSGDFGILVLNGQAQILNPGENVTVNNTTTFTSVPFDWTGLLDQYPGKYIAGVGKIYLMQPTGYEIWGTFTINTLDQTLMTINWNMDTIPTNTLIASVVNGLTPRGTIDRIINPLEFNPGTPVAGTRYLLVEDIGGDGNSDGKGLDQPSIAWGNVVAKTSDIIEYDGTQWQVIFEAAQNSDTLIYQTNIYSGQPQVQYKWNGVSWVKSFEGEYRAGSWRLVL